MNIQSLPWFKFGHDSYLVSEFKAKASAAAKAAYLDLLCFSMKQSPALSLPNDDNVLANWASMAIDAWLQIKDLVLSQFSFNQDNNRYYSPMLVELYSDANSDNNSPAPQQRKRSSSTERVAKHRAKQKGQVTPDVTNTVTEACNDVTQITVTCNADVTPSNVTSNEKTLHLGGRGENLDLRLENLEKEVVVVNTVSVNNQSVTTSNEKVTPSNVTKTTTTKFSMFFDFQIQAARVDLLIEKLKVNPAKNTADNLNNFIAHYLGSSYQNSQADWELHYVKWLKREKESPTANPTETSSTAGSPPKSKVPVAPVKLADDRPRWMIFADKKSAASTEKQQSVMH